MAVERISQRAPIARSGRTDAKRLRDNIYSSSDDAGSSDEPMPANSDRRADVVAAASFVTDDPAKLTADIISMWTRAQEQFLGIGRTLIAARKMIERLMMQDTAAQAMRPADRRARAETEWKKFLEGLPFTQGIASQLEQVAGAVDGGRLARDELPHNYSVAYQLTTLNDAELEAARRHPDIVGPSATRAKIIAFKQRMREGNEHVVILSRRRTRIQEAIARLQQELAEVERQIADTEA